MFVCHEATLPKVFFSPDCLCVISFNKEREKFWPQVDDLAGGYGKDLVFIQRRLVYRWGLV